MRRLSPLALALCAPLALVAAAGCSSSAPPSAERAATPRGEALQLTPPNAAPAPPASPAIPSADATPSTDTAPSDEAASSAADAPSADTALSAADASSANAVPSPSAAPADTPSLPAADDGPLPDVKVVNIGMHIGGGPHDDVTKEPIRRSVAPHFDAFRRCFALAENPTKGGDFGVDLRIGKDGGKAEVREARTALKGEAFTRCVVGVFERIDFLKPRRGPTVVSYSLRFTP